MHLCADVDWSDVSDVILSVNELFAIIDFYIVAAKMVSVDGRSGGGGGDDGRDCGSGGSSGDGERWRR